MRYLDNFNYFVSNKKVVPIKEEVNTSIFENEFSHNHKDIFYTFCSLTHKTYPHGTEQEVLKYIKYPLQQDTHGNYFLKIGESNTMFASHLDSATSITSNVKLITYTQENQKYVSTDGNSILGADDKAGVTVMLYMIEHNIPGLYYFFIGEEIGGVGSLNLSKDKLNETIKGIKRCISFDRNGYNSIITHQMYKPCCSLLFANRLCNELNKYGLKLRKDDTGIFTDSANFTKTVSECTNISVGYSFEHTTFEYQNITYLEKLCQAAININWENLPVCKERFKSIFENQSDTLTLLTSFKPKLALAAQKIYDDWKQVDGIDEMYGAGGICDDIASAMGDIVNNNTDLGSFTLYNEHDTHTSMYAYNTQAKECFCVDIPPLVYEKGFLYNWEKIEGVIFKENMIHIVEVPYDDFVDENGNFKETY